MFKKLICASCQACQFQKRRPTNKGPYLPRIQLSYNPRAYISADVKYMPSGTQGLKFLLSAT